MQTLSSRKYARRTPRKLFRGGIRGIHGSLVPRFAGFWGLLLVLWAPIGAAEVAATLDRNVVSVDDTFRLSLAISGKAAGETPDLAPLNRDFEVLDKSRNSRVSIVNGRVDRRNELVITLAPRHPGDLTIPPLSFGSERSQRLTIRVEEAPQGEQAVPRDVFLETDVVPRNPYLRAQVTYTVRLFYRVLNEGHLSDPDIPDAVVQRMGDDIAYETKRGGRRYKVIERRYAVFPQTAGSLTIPPPLFSGRVPDGGARRRSPFDDFGIGGMPGFDTLFQSTRTIRRQGPAVTVEVRPPPAGVDPKDWLPADSLSLKDEWSPVEPEFRAGEPVTRTLTLLARGQDGSQLPDIPPLSGEGFKVYPDKPVVSTHYQGNFVVGKRIMEYAIVPTRSGTIRLPPVEVSWFNTTAGETRVARIPAREFQVLPGVRPEAPGTGQPGAVLKGPVRGSKWQGPAFWPWVSGGLLLAWLATLLLWRRDRHRFYGQGREQATAPSLREAMAGVDQALRNGSPGPLRDSLLTWGKARWPRDPPGSLVALAKRLPDPDLRGALLDLDRALYADPPGDWRPDQVASRLTAALRAETDPGREVPRQALPALYPDSV